MSKGNEKISACLCALTKIASAADFDCFFADKGVSYALEAFQYPTRLSRCAIEAGGSFLRADRLAQRAVQPKRQHTLRKQDGGDTKAETPVLGLVVKDAHPQQRPRTAAEQGKEEERSFRYAPRPAPGTAFIRAERRERDNADEGKVSGSRHDCAVHCRSALRPGKFRRWCRRFCVLRTGDAVRDDGGPRCSDRIACFIRGVRA